MLKQLLLVLVIFNAASVFAGEHYGEIKIYKGFVTIAKHKVYISTDRGKSKPWTYSKEWIFDAPSNFKCIDVHDEICLDKNIFIDVTFTMLDHPRYEVIETSLKLAGFLKKDGHFKANGDTIEFQIHRSNPKIGLRDGRHIETWHLTLDESFGVGDLPQLSVLCREFEDSESA